MPAQFTQFLPLVLLFIVFYFILIRPQQKKQKQRTSMLSALKKGDQVVTIGGINGTITEINDETVTLRVSETSRIIFERSAISSIKKAAAEKKSVEAKATTESKATTEEKTAANTETTKAE